VIRWREVCLLLAVCACSGACGRRAVQEPVWVQALRQELPAFEIRSLHPKQASCWSGHPSPEGKWLLCAHQHMDKRGQRSPWEFHLRLCDANAQLVRDVTRVRVFPWPQVEWSQTSDAFFFVDLNRRASLLKMDTRTNRVSRQTLPWVPGERWGEPQVPVMSPTGGSYLLAVGDRPGRTGIYRVWLPSGKRRRLTEGTWPTWSPDGEWVAFVRPRGTPSVYRGEWWVVRGDGTGERPVIGEREKEQITKQRGGQTPQGWEGLYPSCWIGTRPGLVLVGGNYGSAEGVYAVDLNGGTANWVDLGPHAELELVSCSRDGRHLYVSVGEGPAGKRVFRLYLVEFVESGAETSAKRQQGPLARQ